jgi:hypothetical protein
LRLGAFQLASSAFLLNNSPQLRSEVAKEAFVLNKSDNDGTVVIAINPEAMIGKQRFVVEITNICRRFWSSRRLGTAQTQRAIQRQESSRGRLWTKNQPGSVQANHSVEREGTTWTSGTSGF